MDEEIALINSQNRNEKIKNFFIKNKNRIIIITSITLLLIFGYLTKDYLNEKEKIKLANDYNSVTINFISGKKTQTEEQLVEIVKKKDKTYSVLSLYFILDNKIITDSKKINELFNIVINETNLEDEIKNLAIYKKALFNSDFETENNLIKILNPVINSNSIWKSHALFLMAEYFYSKNERQKAKEFYSQIISLEKVNPNIKLEAKKRLTRDFSE
jgi:predicted negative regulator of RcsB-dependent stress response